MSRPAQGIWSDVEVAPITATAVDVAREVVERARAEGCSERTRRTVDLLSAAEQEGDRLPRAHELARVAGAPGAGTAEPLRVGPAIVLGIAGDAAVTEAATIAFAAAGGTGADRADLLVAIEVADALAPLLEAVLLDRGTITPDRAVLPAATIAAGLALGVAEGVGPDGLASMVGLLASCVVGSAPVPRVRDALALAVGCAARDVRLAADLVAEGFVVNPRALEAPRGLLDALTGAPPRMGTDALLRADTGSGSVPDVGRGGRVFAASSVDHTGIDDRDPLHVLATFVATADVPEGPRHAARRATANAVGLMVGAADADAVRIARRVVGALGGVDDAAVLGTSERVPAAAAAFLGGIAAHYEDFDDTHLRTVAHPGAAVPPAVVALAQRTGADWTAVLDAVAMGIEVMLRVGDAISPSHLDRGWHVTATTGHVGAAAACARLLDLDVAATANAMALALSVTTGTQAVLGTMAKPFHPGRAARDGLEAALLAASGWSGPSRALDGPDGFLTCGGDAPDASVLLGGLGERWELLDNAFKPYACGIVAHPSIDAGIHLRAIIPDPEDLVTLELTVNPFTLTAMGLATPGHGLEGKFSVHHATSVGYLVGRAGPDEFTDAVVRDPRVIGVRERLRFVPDAAVPRDAVEAVATGRDGSMHRFRIDHATGSVDRPMTDDELQAKIVAEATRTVGQEAAVRLADRLLAPEDGAAHEVLRLATR